MRPAAARPGAGFVPGGSGGGIRPGKPSKPGKPIRPGEGGGLRPGGGGWGGGNWGGGLTPRPDRPNWGKDWSNRPNWGNAWQIGDNHHMNNFVNNINNNFTHIENNYNVFNRRGWNHFADNWNHSNYWGRWHNTRPYYGDWYHGSWHGNYGSAWGYGIGLATSALVSTWAMGPTVYNTGYYSYANPYYSTPLVIQVDGGQQTVINYDQPLQVVPQVAPDENQPQAVPPPITEDSAALLEQARQAFASGDYQQTLSLINRILAASPNDPVVHQLRALLLFATTDYRQASAALYSVLSVGPPWDWTTMSGMYANTDTYAQQFHELESYAQQNPQAAYAHFLLGYHCMVCGYNDEAIAEFKQALQLEPSDHLAANLVTMLGGTLDDTEHAVTSDESDDTEIVEVDPSALFGTWISKRTKGPQIDLTLGADGKFTWTVKQAPRSSPTVMQGEFSLGGDKLVLQPNEGSPMMGTVSDVADGKFTFRIVGAPPGDKGLQFVGG